MKKYKKYTLSTVEANEFTNLMEEHESKFYDEIQSLNYAKVFTNEDKQKLHKLNEGNLPKVELFVKITNDNQDFVGWCYGCQNDHLTFTMHSSYILSEFRNQGIYSALMDYALNWAKEKGFVKVNSRHGATNNPIIIQKLKKGFVISGMEVNERFGLTVNLTYFFKEELRAINQVRVGLISEDEKLLEYFKRK